eukprot:TRINITY_DN27219_c0_g1_i1.p1 TRINITY_DN27219_c0_g1~~TRINITY_DN27219_c0_g1_i1.p1  ORF type:complete len:738 (+),score=186.00 TRINITY_DN27219_c0_g1_i1:73-2286(+)
MALRAAALAACVLALAAATAPERPTGRVLVLQRSAVTSLANLRRAEKWSVAVNARYAQRHGYDYGFVRLPQSCGQGPQRSAAEVAGNKTRGRSFAACEMLATLAVLEQVASGKLQYKWVLQLDLDAFVVNHRWSIPHLLLAAATLGRRGRSVNTTWLLESKHAYDHQLANGSIPANLAIFVGKEEEGWKGASGGVTLFRADSVAARRLVWSWVGEMHRCAQGADCTIRGREWANYGIAHALSRPRLPNGTFQVVPAAWTHSLPAAQPAHRFIPRRGGETHPDWNRRAAAWRLESRARRPSNGHFARHFTGECSGSVRATCIADAVARLNAQLAEDGLPPVQTLPEKAGESGDVVSALRACRFARVPAPGAAPSGAGKIAFNLRLWRCQGQAAVAQSADLELIKVIDQPWPSWPATQIRDAANPKKWGNAIRRYMQVGKRPRSMRTTRSWMAGVECNYGFNGTLRRAQDCEMRDLFHSLFWQKEGGIALELGGLDGLRGPSQTMPLHELAGWRRVLIEGDPRYRRDRMRHASDAIAVTAAVCDTPGTVHYLHGKWRVIDGIAEFMHRDFVKDFHPEVYKLLPSGTTRRDFESGAVWKRAQLPVELAEPVHCLPLHHILREAFTPQQVPYHLDLAIIDVEGGELSVLRSIDWTKFSASVLCVETQETRGESGRHVRPKGFLDDVIALVLERSRGKYKVMWRKRGRNTWFRHVNFVPSRDPAPPYSAPDPDQPYDEGEAP